MKKVLGIVMALLLLAVSIVPVAVAADEGAVITISKIEKAAGETIAAGEKFDITLSTNEIANVGSFNFVLRYNKTFMSVANTATSGFLAEMEECTVKTAAVGNTLYEEISIAALDYSTPAPAAAGGVILTITFEAKKEITENTAIFAVAEKCEMYDDWMNFDTPTELTIVDGGVTIPTTVTEETTTTTTTNNTTDPAEDRDSLLPDSADKFTCVAGGDGNVTVTAEGNGYKFVADKGWPSAYYHIEDSQITLDTASDETVLYYDFEVKSGEANVYVFFAGINPGDKDLPEGTFVSLNKFIDQSKVNSESGDIAVGIYKGFVKASDLGCGAAYLADGKFTVSGMKVFAVGGEVIVNELSVGAADGEGTTESTESTASTTLAGGSTTTVTKQDTAKQDSAKTGDVSNAVIFIIVAIVAAALIAVSVVMSKKKQEQ